MERINCPSCHQQMEISADCVGQWVTCPFCNTDFETAGLQPDLHVIDDTPEFDSAAELRFDALRIKHYSTLRMTAIRSRSWWLILQLFCVLCVVNLLAKTAILVWIAHRWGAWPTVFVLSAIAMGYLSRYAAGKAAVFNKEIARSALTPPTHPPDFSTLSDGKEQWKNLENIR